MAQTSNNVSRKGFTLIELLVVIAIIGILASVILPSLSAARERASDAKVRAQVSGIRNQASMYHDIGDTYLGMCDAGTDIRTMVDVSKDVVATPMIFGGLGDGECYTDGLAWAVWVNLKYASTSAYCADSTGSTRIVAMQNSSASDLLVCP